MLLVVVVVTAVGHRFPAGRYRAVRFTNDVPVSATVTKNESGVKVAPPNLMLAVAFSLNCCATTGRHEVDLLPCWPMLPVTFLDGMSIPKRTCL